MFGYRLARGPGPLALLLAIAIAVPAANAAGPRAHRARAHAHAGKRRSHRPKTPKPSTQAPPKTAKPGTQAPPKTAKPGTPAPPKTSVNPSCANNETSAANATGAAMTASVLCLTNQQRAAHGLPALHEDIRLDRSAQSWTNTMVETHTFSHGTNFTGRIDAVGYDWSNAGENIGTGYATPHQIVTAWMASPDHCRNILDPNYADVGTGVLARGIAPYGPSTWTQDFGLSMEESAPSSNTTPMNGCPYTG